MNFLGAATYCHPSFRPLHVSGKTGSVYLPPLPKRRPTVFFSTPSRPKLPQCAGPAR